MYFSINDHPLKQVSSEKSLGRPRLELGMLHTGAFEKKIASVLYWAQSFMIKHLADFEVQHLTNRYAFLYRQSLQWTSK